MLWPVTPPFIKSNLGCILSKLPPELQRAGRDVLGAAKRNLPIGRVTGGRVFPPF